MSRFRDVGVLAAEGRIPPSPDNSPLVGSYNIVCKLRGGEAY